MAAYDLGRTRSLFQYEAVIYWKRVFIVSRDCARIVDAGGYRIARASDRERGKRSGGASYEAVTDESIIQVVSCDVTGCVNAEWKSTGCAWHAESRKGTGGAAHETRARGPVVVAHDSARIVDAAGISAAGSVGVVERFKSPGRTQYETVS